MNKEEYIKRHGEAAYKKGLQQSNEWNAAHREECRLRVEKWGVANPEKVKANHHEASCKGGKHYEHMLEHKRTGLPGERSRIRTKHAVQYRPFKHIIAPDSQIHHEWIPGTAKYRGVALVEKDQHMHGYIDVIKILEGKITLQTEQKGVRR